MLGLPRPKYKKQSRRVKPKAPSNQDFAALLVGIRKGTPVTSGAHFMDTKKACRATYCLGESLQESYRSLLSKCCTMNLRRDERTKRLQLGWRAGTTDLVVRNVSAGFVKAHGSGAIGITLCTQQILVNLCARSKPPPYSSATVPEPQFEEEFFIIFAALLKQLLSILHLMNWSPPATCDLQKVV